MYTLEKALCRFLALLTKCRDTTTFCYLLLSICTYAVCNALALIEPQLPQLHNTAQLPTAEKQEADASSRPTFWFVRA